MRTDIQQNLQIWLGSPECEHYLTTLCPAEDLRVCSENLADVMMVLNSFDTVGDDEATLALPMINVESLPPEVRANLGGTVEDTGHDACCSRVA